MLAFTPLPLVRAV